MRYFLLLLVFAACQTPQEIRHDISQSEPYPEERPQRTAEQDRARAQDIIEEARRDKNPCTKSNLYSEILLFLPTTPQAKLAEKELKKVITTEDAWMKKSVATVVAKGNELAYFKLIEIFFEMRDVCTAPDYVKILDKHILTLQTKRHEKYGD